jgi:ketosteroid isomerase-like protein
MPQENVERVQRDFGQLFEEMRHRLDAFPPEEIEVTNYSPEKIIDAGGNRVVAVVRQSSHLEIDGVVEHGGEDVGGEWVTGRGAPVDMLFGVVLTIENGRVIDRQIYLNPVDALEAVGLSEQDAHADS